MTEPNGEIVVKIPGPESTARIPVKDADAAADVVFTHLQAAHDDAYIQMTVEHTPE